MEPPSPEFLIYCNISKRFCLQWMRYTLLETCDVINNGRHPCRIGFYQELGIRLKAPFKVVFSAIVVFFFSIYRPKITNLF